MDQISKLIQRQMKQQLLILGCMLVALMGFAQTSETKVEDNLILTATNSTNRRLCPGREKIPQGISPRTQKHHRPTQFGQYAFDESYYGEAFNAYKSATMSAQSKEEKHSALHNMGNVFMNQKDYAKAVETYKEALRNNPKDDQTRYNYAWQRVVGKRKPEPRSKPRSRKKTTKTNKIKTSKTRTIKTVMSSLQKTTAKTTKIKIKRKQDQQDQSIKKRTPKPTTRPKTQPTKLSPQQIKNLLEAMNNEEKKVQDKVNAKRPNPLNQNPKKTGMNSKHLLLDCCCFRFWLGADQL